LFEFGLLGEVAVVADDARDHGGRSLGMPAIDAMATMADASATIEASRLTAPSGARAVEPQSILSIVHI
jgi:hypothetical protein